MEIKQYIKNIIKSDDESKHEEMIECVECLLEKIEHEDDFEEMER